MLFVTIDHNHQVAIEGLQTNEFIYFVIISAEMTQQPSAVEHNGIVDALDEARVNVIDPMTKIYSV